MSESWQIALFTVLGGGMLTAMLAGLAGYINVLFRQGESDRANERRMTRLETQFEDWLNKFGTVAAKMLHSPDNHLGIDHYLDVYLSKHYDMSNSEWDDLREVCIIVMSNPLSTKPEQIMAEFLKNLCEHKLQRSGVTPGNPLK